MAQPNCVQVIKFVSIILLFSILQGAFAQGTTTPQYRYLILFKDKASTNFSVNNPQAFLSQRAITRRQKMQIKVTEQDLPTFQVPFLPSDKKYRVFPIKGDSMLPLQPGSLVFAEYVEDWTSIKDGTICIVVTREDGVVLKQVINHLAERKVLILNSTNKTYDPYPILGAEIQEIWKFAGYFHNEFPNAE